MSSSTSEYSDLPPPPPASENSSSETTTTPSKPQVKLTDIEINNEITALNIMVQFLGLAQKRGAFTIDEAAKIWECVKKFQKPQVSGEENNTEA